MTPSDTLERIVAATLGLNAERGLGKVSMSDVARAAGVARQTLYNPFDDVDGIVAAAVSAHTEVATRQLVDAVTVVDGAPEKISQLARQVALSAMHEGHDLDFQHALAPEHRGLTAAYAQALDALLAEVIAEGVADGEFRADLDVDVAAVLIRHQLLGLAHLAATAPADVARATGHATRLILAGLTAGSSAP